MTPTPSAAFASPLTIAAARAPAAAGQVGAQRRAAIAAPAPTARPRRAAVRAAPTMISLFPWAKNSNNGSKPAGKPASYGFDVGFAYLAHPEKGSGEDAFFVEGNCAGVFDGVSGAAEAQGVDPRLYSQTLAASTAEKARQYGPKAVVKAAIDASRANREIGASTACVVGLDDYGRLFGVNLGDSGVLIVRDRRQIFRTTEQQHFFNCPYQLSSVTSPTGANGGDDITMGQNIQQNLQPGDWIILATDGLFDNVFNKDIVALVNQAESPQQVADQLGDLAAENSLDTKLPSPYQAAARKANVQWTGGKVDDVTVVVLHVKDDPTHEPVSLLSSVPS